MRSGKPTPPKGVARSRPSRSPEERATALVPAGKFQLNKILLPHKAKATVRFCSKFLFRAALLAVFVCGVSFAGLHARLAHSPISMGFLVSPVEKAVNRTLSGLHFDIGDAVLRRAKNGFGIEFRLANVRLLDDDNSPVVESPFASGDVSLRALLTGRFAASHIELINPVFYLQYSDEKGLALSFADPRESKGNLKNSTVTEPQSWAAKTGERQQTVEADTGTQETEGLIRTTRGRAVNLTHALTDIFERTRQGESAYLTSFGIRDASVYFDKGEQITRWAIPSAEIDLRHRGKGSAVLGIVSVQSPNETFQFNFQVKQNRRSGQLALKIGVDDLIPRTFGSEFPQFRLPAMWNMPVTLTADMALANNGDILSGTIQASLKQGEFYVPWDQKHPAIIDSGNLSLTYSREDGLIKLTASEIRWGESHLKMSGALRRQRETGRWSFEFESSEIALGAQQFGLPVIPLDGMQAKGEYDPKQGAVALDRFFIQAADANIGLTGRFVQGQTSPAIQLSGRISPMPIAFFKLIWPKFIAHGARDWIGRRIPSGRIAGGEVKIDIPANLLSTLASGGHLSADAVNFRLDLEDLELHYIQGLPPMHIPKGTAQVAGHRFLFNAQSGRIVAPFGEPVAFSDGQFIVGDLRPNVPKGEVHFKSEARASAVLSLLDHPNLGYISALKMPVPDIDAQVTTTFSIAMPMYRNLKFKDMKLNGRSNVENVRASNLPGGLTVEGGQLNFDVTERAIEGRGDLAINGLKVVGSWQRIFDAPADRQPPLRLRTVLDDKARERLGLGLDHIVRGAAPAALTVNFRGDEAAQIHAELDLTESEILMASLGWRKPPGQRAMLNVDVQPAENVGFELRDINLLGDQLAVRGAVRLNGRYQPVAFDFPAVSLNLQTQMEMRGELAAQNIWKVRLRGASYDGRRFFRSLFSAGKIVEDQPHLPKDSPGVDIDAQFDTVVGFFDTTLKNVKLTAERRGNKLTYLDLNGQLNGNSPLAAQIRTEQGTPRQILAEANDAGAAFRLVGFYPSARGGQILLEVNLDGSGTAEKSGTLYARNFSIANNQVVEEVLSVPKQRNKNTGQQQQGYDQLQFDRMRVPFSVGGGQFSLHDAAINGPLLGATLRGTIDFERERINLAGTYVPFYGINGALGLVPILGDLLISRNGEGLFGITFAVKGRTSKPDVLVNPMSMVAPGFLRQLFEFDQQAQPRILPPDQRTEQKTGARSRNSPPVTR